MIKEFIIEPSAIFEVLDPRVIIDGLGVNHGRVVYSSDAEPEDWLARINDELQKYIDEGKTDKIGLRRYKYIEKWLAKHSQKPYKKYIIERSIPDLFSGDVSVTGKAIKTAEIITKDGRNKTREAMDITPNIGWWRVDSYRTFRKSVENYISLLETSLRISEEIIIIDPYFAFRDDDNLGSQKKVIEAIIKKCDPLRLKSFTIICLHGFEGDSTEEWNKKCTDFFGPLFNGSTARVNIMRVKTRPKRDPKRVKFHDRHIITDHIGFSIGYGFEADENMTHASRMHEYDRENHRKGVLELLKEDFEDYDQFYSVKRVDMWVMNDQN